MVNCEPHHFDCGSDFRQDLQMEKNGAKESGQVQMVITCARCKSLTIIQNQKGKTDLDNERQDALKNQILSLIRGKLLFNELQESKTINIF